MFSSIRTSGENRVIVSELSKKFNLGPENVIARIAICYSLATGKKLNLSSIKDSKGKEYNKNTLFGKYTSFYIALICQHYKIYKSDINIPKYIKLHIDDGLELISSVFKKHPNYSTFDFLLKEIEKSYPI